ncbi:MAG TPA: YicC family protein [Alphaproteobacteria bacterium]|nr:YicC family protein [Alphaproteobacteria bacterium]
MESMTGFGACAERRGFAWTWTLRSVNGKGLEIRCRLPQGYEDLEQKVRDSLRSFFTRGSLTVSLDVDDAQIAAPKLNEAFLEKLCRLAVNLQQKYPALRPASIDGLMNVRGVCDADARDDAAVRDERTGLFLSSLEKAAEALKNARLTEGAKIAACLSEAVDRIERLVAQAKSRAAAQPEAIRRKLAENLSVLTQTTGLSEDRFMQEVTACMLRADVREELDRLAAHVRTARELFAERGAIGKKLDFLCQEFNREANTLCSKSADMELTKIGLELKSVIDQLREQTQNIE